MNWVSVTDTLPGLDRLVLLYSPKLAGPLPGRLVAREGTVMYQDGISLHYLELHAVTHWMPMPAPPEGDRQEAKAA